MEIGWEVVYGIPLILAFAALAFYIALNKAFQSKGQDMELEELDPEEGERFFREKGTR